MKPLLIVIVTIIVILIFVFLISRNILHGGEYVNIKYNDKIIKPTISQIPISNQFKGSVRSLINESANSLIKNAQVRFNQTDSFVLYLIENKRVSDACIDLIGIKKSITEGISSNESDIYMNNEDKALVTLYNIHEPKYIFRNKNIEFVRGSDLLFNMEGDYKNPNIRIYIEYVYDKLTDLKTAYQNIHISTIALLKGIIHENDTKTSNKIYISRFYIYNNGMFRKIVYKDKRSIDGVEIISRDSIEEYDNFGSVNVPNSLSLLFDEVLIFKDKSENIYNCQIEHSEGTYKHKSNLFEFILRNLNKCKDFDKVADLTMWWNYTLYTDDTYDFKFEKNTKKEECAFYKAWPEFLKHFGFLNED